MQQNKQSHSSNKHRTKEHEALLRLKSAQQNFDTLQRRFKYLQVKDQENRSRTIQHEKKLQMHDLYRQQIKREQQIRNRQQLRRIKQIELAKSKNMELKQAIEENIKSAREKIIVDKEEEVKVGRETRVVNEELIEKFKEKQIQDKQKKRRSVVEKEEAQKLNVSRYLENKRNQTIVSKSVDASQILSAADKKEKQMEKLSKMEEEMIKRSSESLQASQFMKNRLREVLGDQRRFLRLPSIRNKNASTRGSTGQTQIISI